jgi:hypothetical protein
MMQLNFELRYFGPLNGGSQSICLRRDIVPLVFQPHQFYTGCTSGLARTSRSEYHTGEPKSKRALEAGVAPGVKLELGLT